MSKAVPVTYVLVTATRLDRVSKAVASGVDARAMPWFDADAAMNDEMIDRPVIERARHILARQPSGLNRA